MKLVKMSLVAALLVGTSVFAVENTKVSGSASIFYGTDDSSNGDLFNKATSFGQAELGLGLTTDLSDTVKANANLTVLSTLGLQGQLVGNVWESTNGLDDSYWFDTANISANLGNTTNVTIGRMALDTPLVFTETWSIATNTFEAAVVANTDLPNTTLVGAYVGGSNGAKENASTGWVVADMNANGTSNFSQFYNGAYALAVVNNSWKPLTAQAWYYGATKVLSAYWIQADLNLDGIVAGIQYTGGSNADNSDYDGSFAAKVGYETEAYSVSGSYSQTGEKGGSAANLSGSGQSKFYTEAWYVFMVGGADTTSYNVTANTSIAGIDAGVYYTSATAGSGASEVTQSEITVDAAKSFDGLDTAIAFSINDSDAPNTDAINTIQVFLTYNF